MRAIIAVFTNSPISIIMVGCTKCLRTFLCWLCPCVCTHIFSCVRVSGGHSDILHRFSFVCQSFMDVCLVIWKSVLSGCLSSTALLLILSVLSVFSGALVDILVLKSRSDGSVVDRFMLFFRVIPFIFCFWCLEMVKASFVILAPYPVQFYIHWF